MANSRIEIPFGTQLFLRAGEQLRVQLVVVSNPDPGHDGRGDVLLASAAFAAIPRVERVTVTASGPSEFGHDEASMTVEEIAKYVEGDGTDSQRVALADGIRRKHI